MKKRWILPAAAVLAIALLLFFIKGTPVAQEETDSPGGAVTSGADKKPGAHGGEEGGDVLKTTFLENVWLLSSEDCAVTFFADGSEQTLATRGTLSEPVSEGIADLTVTNGKITKIVIKEDAIAAKVLSADKEGVELEGYGKLPYTEHKKIYRMYDGLCEETAEKLMVGQNITFILENGSVCAALMQEKPDLTNIRVLIGTNGYAGFFHETVEITCDVAFRLECGETREIYAAGEHCKLTAEDFMTQPERRVFTACTPDGTLRLVSLKRKQGQPSYRGTIEISKGEEGLLVINELPIEEYLYAVLPSEMPSEFPMEALKTQAVCARSYAVTAMLSGRYAGYGAHVDDSVASQVYNNIKECESSIRAVKETHGQVLLYEGSPVSAYYYSTSCGYSAAIEDVWKTGKKTAYLPGILHIAGEKNDGGTVYPAEEEFAAFLNDPGVPTYDEGSPWYRWQVFLPFAELEKTMLSALKARYTEAPEQILTCDEASGQFLSQPPEELGEIVSIRVKSRGSGGIATELLVYGSKKTYLVKNEYNIRSVLAPSGQTVYRKYAEEVNGTALLASAFFILTRGEYKGGEGYLCTGGGSGHGVGMSQYGAKGMAENGCDYEEIIGEYYPGTELGFIYSEKGD